MAVSAQIRGGFSKSHQKPKDAPLAWCLVAGWIWLLAGLRGDPAWSEITPAALYLASVCVAGKCFTAQGVD
jgi:hypothetical protein